MRVLFIYPNLYSQVGFNYGLASLSAVLKRAGHETSLININEKLGVPLDLSLIKERMDSFKPGLVAFSVLTNQYQYVQEMARFIKDQYQVPMVCGGIHATMAPGEVLSSGLFDYVCVGEGEGALVELADALEGGERPTHIANIYTLIEGHMVANKVRPFVDLSQLPMKDYELFEFQKLIDAKDGWVGLMTSRGCPFRCSYCLNHRVVDIYHESLGLSLSKLGYLRRQPIEQVREELSFLLSHYQNIKTFILDDDLFTHDRTYVEEFCEVYRSLTNIPFVCNAHVQFFDLELGKTLKRAGCRLVKFGIESGSERIRKEVLNRPMSNEKIAHAFARAHEAGLETSAFVMIGLPFEGRAEVMETLELLAKVKPSRMRWSFFFPYINTRAYQISEQGGFIDKNKLETLSNFTDQSCLDFGHEHNLFLQKLQRTFPWQVNALSDLPTSRFYQSLIKHVERMGPYGWHLTQEAIIPFDQSVSKFFEKAQRLHYSYRYNTFTALQCPC